MSLTFSSNPCSISVDGHKTIFRCPTYRFLDSRPCFTFIKRSYILKTSILSLGHSNKCEASLRLKATRSYHFKLRRNASFFNESNASVHLTACALSVALSRKQTATSLNTTSSCLSTTSFLWWREIRCCQSWRQLWGASIKKSLNGSSLRLKCTMPALALRIKPTTMKFSSREWCGAILRKCHHSKTLGWQIPKT